MDLQAQPGRWEKLDLWDLQVKKVLEDSAETTDLLEDKENGDLQDRREAPETRETPERMAQRVLMVLRVQPGPRG